MSLVPTAGVLGTVAKLDAKSPEAARMLLTLSLYESMLDQSDDVWAEIAPEVFAKMAETLVVARTALLRGHVGKMLDENGDSEELVYARSMAVLETHIEKGLAEAGQAIRDLFNRKHPRGEDGRWVSANVGSGTTTAGVLPMDSQSSLHAEAESKAAQWQSQGLIDESTPITAHHRKIGPDGKPIKGPAGENKTTTKIGTLVDDLRRREDSAPNTLQLEGLSLTRDAALENKTPQHRAALDVMASVMGTGDGTGRRLLNALPMDRDGKRSSQDHNAKEWNRPGSDGDRQSFRRMSMTGGLLSSISAPGSTVNTVGGLAQLVGNLGPEAEKVLGPGMRRTAYRYRGTEKRPDKALVNGVKEANSASRDLDFDRSKAGDAKQQGRLVDASSKITARINPRGGMATGSIRSAGPKVNPRADVDPVALTNHYWMNQRVPSEDFRAMGMRGDAAVVNMLDDLPDKALTELAVASGELPPSQGVIIDAGGSVVTQAMGYNGDHYLPFDLKNLNALHGGAYVRTRAHGGPTTEDVYTGLLTGARQVQVVSNSGVFTLEFDPDLRGGRRYSDKAARMVSRYGKILETITAKPLYQNDLSPEKLKELKATAMKHSGGVQTVYTDNLDTLKTQARMESEIAAEGEEEELAEGAGYAARSAITSANKIRSTNGQGPLSTSEAGMVADQARADFETKNANPAVRRLKLDGPGYERALKTLRQEFPYFIRQAKWESLPDFLRARGIQNTREFRRFAPSDSGHVRPGQNHALRDEAWAKRTTAATETETSETTEQAAGTGTVRAAAGLGGATKTIAAATAPGTVFADKLAKSVNSTFGVFLTALPATPMPPEGAKEHEIVDPGHFTAFKMEQFQSEVGPRKAASAFATWLVNPSTSPAYKQRVAKALDSAIKTAETTDGYDASAVRAAGAELTTLLNIVAPFADADPNPTLAIPDPKNPKPQPYSDFPNVVGTKAYDSYMNDQFSRNKPFHDTVETFKGDYLGEGGLDNEAMANLIEEAVSAFKAAPADKAKALEPELANMQKAWSFLAARDAAAQLEKIGGSAGDAAPLDPAAPVIKGLDGRRRIVFHKSNDQFSRLARAALRNH